jgi:hypothetical protein
MVAATTPVKEINREQYSAIYRQPQIELPSVEELIESRIARLTDLDLATENDRVASPRTSRTATSRSFRPGLTRSTSSAGWRSSSTAAARA